MGLNGPQQLIFLLLQPAWQDVADAAGVRGILGGTMAPMAPYHSRVESWRYSSDATSYHWGSSFNIIYLQ